MSNYDGNQITFSDVCQYIENIRDKDLIKAAKSIFNFGLLFLPAIFVHYTNNSGLFNDVATGATLAGSGICTIVGNALNAFFKRNKTDYHDNYIKMQTAYYMCYYAAFFEAIDEDILVEGNDDLMKSFKPATEEQHINDFSVSFKSRNSIKQGYDVLSEMFKDFFYSSDYIQKLDDEEQYIFYNDRIKGLSSNAAKKFEEQIVQICNNYSEFYNWLSVTFQSDIKDQISKLPEAIAGRVSDRVVDNLAKKNSLRKEVRNWQGENYFYLFGDRQCEVEDVFTLKNYQVSTIGSADPKEKVSSIQNILDIIKSQKFLLISGPYGSGKTTLLKRLYIEFLRLKQAVYAFEAKDLFEISSREKRVDFYEFFDVLCEYGNDTVFLIDGLDDLNVPITEGSENSLLINFIIHMFSYLKDRENVYFVIASRQYAYIHDDHDDTVAEKVYCYTPAGTDMRIIESVYFSPEDVYYWIDNYPLKKGVYINKKLIKEANKKIVDALKNPLFLYVFIKQYEIAGEIKPFEGFYYYYEEFINQTIQGKFRYESVAGAEVISNNIRKYRDLIQKIAYDILKKYSNKIRSIINPIEIGEEQPLLSDELQKYKFDITFDEFSDVTNSCFNDLKSETIDKANFLNCYFLKTIENRVFFTDVNILFTLAAERIFQQLILLSGKETFDLSHLAKLDVIDFYPQIIDYVIYKLREYDNRSFRMYLRSFVLNTDIRNRIDVSGKNEKELCETFAQILMLYILFFKKNKNALSDEYSHVFKEMMYYVNAYKTFSYKQGQADNIYTVERYFMRNILDSILLKRVNLKYFNFQNSIIKDAKFLQCKFLNTNFYNAELRGDTSFDLCDFRNAQLLFAKSEQQKTMIFRDCRINQMTIKPQKKCRFLRCYIKELMLHPHDLEEIRFEKCVIEKLIFAKETSSNKTEIIFDACTFSTNINCSGFEGWIKIISNCIKLKEGRLFRSMIDNRIDGISKLI